MRGDFWHDRKIVSHERLTRHEISWLLAQEARGAAKALREGVSQLRQGPTSPSEPRILHLPSEAPPSDGPAVETTLDALDDAISMLSDLNVAARGGKARRGRIDLAALLMDLAPNTRIAMEPGAGTEVMGDETDLRRMLNLLVTQAGSTQAGAAEVMIRRQAEWVKISVELGPDAGGAELERRWLSRMATRHGGWVELEGGTQSIFLPADGASDQREVVELRKELEQAQQLGETYARELASVLSAGDIRTEPPPPIAPRTGSQRFETLQTAALGMQRTIKGLVDGLRADASLASSELGETSALTQSLQRRAATAAEISFDLALASDCPFDEPRSEVSVMALVKTAIGEAEPRAGRHGVAIEVKGPSDLRIVSRPKTLGALIRAMLHHAISATPRGGQITFCAYAVETGVLLSAQDGGPSVTEAVRADVLRNRIDPSAFGRPSGVSLLIAEAAAESLGASLELRDGLDGQAEVWTMLSR
jgi:two-component system OmpR family sensor kinase